MIKQYFLQPLFAVVASLFSASSSHAKPLQIGEAYYCAGDQDAVVAFVILRIERFGDIIPNSEPQVAEMQIAHLTLAAPGTPEIPVIAHAPFDLAAVIDCDPNPFAGSVAISPTDFEDGYGTWRNAFEQQDAGVFTVSPVQAYGAILATMTQN